MMLGYIANASAEETVAVIDGDTIDLGGVRYRLHGIDAPEAGQTCAKQGGGTWQCGKQAIKELERLTASGNVSCSNLGEDGYGRTLGVCRSGSMDMNEAMVREGLAWSFRRYADDYNAVEDEARSKQVGVWQADTQTPWDYRAERWSAAEQEAPDGCPIKGNISRNGQIYHAPWSPWYSRTKINTAKGERWFCTEGEAVKAGWRAPYWGRRS
jgi:endonuclease YncB( thermonuclease family)